jgi:hypothetical protein
MRGQVCNLLLLLVLASAVPLWSESHRTQDHILLSQFLRLPQPGGPGPHIYIPRNRVAQIYPRARGNYWITCHLILYRLITLREDSSKFPGDLCFPGQLSNFLVFQT